VCRRKAAVVRSRLIASVELTRSASHMVSLSGHLGPTARSLYSKYKKFCSKSSSTPRSIDNSAISIRFRVPKIDHQINQNKNNRLGGGNKPGLKVKAGAVAFVHS